MNCRPRASGAQALRFHTNQIKLVIYTICHVFHLDKSVLGSVGREEKEPSEGLPLERKGELLHRMTAKVPDFQCQP